MEFKLSAPSNNPTLDEQADALQKGQGRAMAWALDGLLDDSVLLNACLIDQRFDLQIEECRGEWLWMLIKASGNEARFRESLFEEFDNLWENWSQFQLCELAYYYAAKGDNDFREKLYDVVKQFSTCETPGLGEREIMTLDGEVGFLFAAKLRGQHLLNREWDWHDNNVVWEASELFGEEAVARCLKRSGDNGVRRFYECWLGEKSQSLEKQSSEEQYRQELQSISVEEIIDSAKTGNSRFRGWGMRAQVEDLKVVLSELWAAKDPDIIANYLRVFSNRALPEFDPRIIDLCRHSADQVRRAAFSALQMNAHMQVRQFAIENIRCPDEQRFFVALLARNYELGDEELVLDSIHLPEDADELHWLLMDVIDVLKQNELADPTKLVDLVYAHTPCGHCRFNSVQILHNRGQLPPWMATECRHDSSRECRQLFSAAT